MKRNLFCILTLAFTGACFAQAPWPLERQDRWGTAHALSGPDPATMTTPWVSNRLATGWPVSYGVSLGEGGIGYFGDWVDNKLFKIDYNTGALLGAFQADNFVLYGPAIQSASNVIFDTDAPAARVFGIDTGIMDYNWFMNTGYLGGAVNLGPEGDAAISTKAGLAARLNPLTGTPVWSHPGLGSALGSPVFTRDDSRLIVSNGTFVTALNWSNGTTAWNINYGSAMGRPAVAPNGTIVVGSDSGTIYGLNPANGTILWTWVTLNKVEGAPAFSPDGTVAYLPGYDNRIWAIRVSDGVRLWSFTTSLWCEHGPTVGFDGSIYVHNKNGDLYRISASGSQIWQVHLNGEARGPLTISPDGTLYVGFTGSNSDSGMAIIRQHSIALDPDGLSMDVGAVQSGGLPQLLASDDDDVVMKQSIFGSTSAQIRTIITTHAPYFPVNRLSLTIEGHVTATSINQTIQLWNGSSWETVDARAATTSDSTVSLTLNNAQRFTDGLGLIKVRVGWASSSAFANSAWKSLLDYVHFDVVPQFVAP